MRGLFAAIAVALASASATAGPTGIGPIDCGSWFLAEQRLQNHSWLDGYLSGVSMTWAALKQRPQDPLSEIKNSNQAYLWMDSYCKANPLSHVHVGAAVLWAELASGVGKN